jgi:DNA-binding response OmpR family regulator
MPRILVVDDESAILFAMDEYFSARGYEVDCARGLEEAGARLQASRYEAVIADLRLTGSGGTEGLEVVERVRSHHPSTRVIILTAFGSPEVEREARRRGADAFLHKPVPLPELARVLTGPA